MINPIAHQRLFNHRISGRRCLNPEEVVNWMGAMQAQDYKQALWAIGVRLQDGTVTAVEEAISAGKIVRTWSQRGTIHFVPAVDTQWMLDLCASRILAGHGRRMRQLELTDEIMTQCETLVVEALSGGRVLPRSAVFDLFERAGVSTAGARGYHILWHIAHKGVICMGPMAGREQTFCLLGEWVPDLRHLTRDEALAELVRRFFASRAPATERDFARWSGLTLTDTRRGIQMNQLESFTLEETTYWMGKPSPKLQAPEKLVYLLPAYDEYLLGYQDRRAVLADEDGQKVVPGKNGVFQPLIVVDGRVVGIWKRKLKARSIDITFYPFAALGEVEEQVVAEAQTYGRFMGLPVRTAVVSE
ncbi:MAG: winged helix DNA-binding domain-containing protein [Ardenticatenaceae bacterium]|nr:winged helix DNA-binding domain-containing protein [Ardenticatenaceae bacterium]